MPRLEHKTSAGFFQTLRPCLECPTLIQMRFPELKYLDISDNVGLRWNNQKTWISSCQNLETFIGSNCNFDTFPEDLKDLDRIQKIDLNRNELVYPVIGWFDRLTDTLEEIVWEENPWQCDCEILSFARYLEVPKLVSLFDHTVKCHNKKYMNKFLVYGVKFIQVYADYQCYNEVTIESPLYTTSTQTSVS